MAIVLLLNIKVFLYPIQRVLISMESHTSDKKERCRPRTRSKGAIANDASTVGKIKWTFHGLSSLLSIRNSLIEFHKSPDKNRRVACYSPGGKGRTFEKYARNKRKGAKKKKNRGRSLERNAAASAEGRSYSWKPVGRVWKGWELTVVTQGSKTKAAALTISILLSRVPLIPLVTGKSPGC